jgi:hypothetical protein
MMSSKENSPGADDSDLVDTSKDSERPTASRGSIKDQLQRQKEIEENKALRQVRLLQQVNDHLKKSKSRQEEALEPTTVAKNVSSRVHATG